MDELTNHQRDYRNDAQLDVALFYARRGSPQTAAWALANAIGYAAIRWAASYDDYMNLP